MSNYFIFLKAPSLVSYNIIIFYLLKYKWNAIFSHFNWSLNENETENLNKMYIRLSFIVNKKNQRNLKYMWKDNRIFGVFLKYMHVINFILSFNLIY